MFASPSTGFSYGWGLEHMPCERGWGTGAGDEVVLGDLTAVCSRCGDVNEKIEPGSKGQLLWTEEIFWTNIKNDVINIYFNISVRIIESIENLP